MPTTGTSPLIRRQTSTSSGECREKEFEVSVNSKADLFLLATTHTGDVFSSMVISTLSERSNVLAIIRSTSTQMTPNRTL